MNEFSLGARLTLADDFTDNLKQALKAVEEFNDNLEGLESTVTAAGTDMAKASTQADKLGKELGEAGKDAKKSEESFISVGGTIKKLAGIVGTYLAANTIKDFALGAIEAAASTEALGAQFDEVFKGVQYRSSEALRGISQQTNIAEGRLKESFTRIAAFAKTTGADGEAALDLTSRATIAAADSAAFYDRSIEEVTENLQSFLKGNYENDSALGISATEATRNAAALAEYGKEFSKLDEQQKQLTLLALVEQGNELSGALGQAAREGTAYENVVGNLRQAFTDFKSTVGGPLLEPFNQAVQRLTGYINGLDPAVITAKIESGIAFAVTAFNNFRSALTTVRSLLVTFAPVIAGLVASFVAFRVITTIQTAFTAFTAVLALVRNATIVTTIAQHGFNAALRANPIGFVITLIGLLVAAGVLLYQNWDTVKAATIAVWGAIRTFVAGAIQFVQNVIQIGIAFITTAWNQGWQNVSNITSTIISGIQALLSGVNLFEIGANIIQGLTEGVKSAAAGVLDAVKGVASGIKNAVTGFFDIHSPSRLFRYEIGQQIGAGWALGITDTANMVHAASEALSTAALPDGASIGTNGVNVPPVAAAQPQTGGGGQIVIEKMIENIELAVGDGINVEEMVQQLINTLYSKLSQANEILTQGV